MKKLLIGAVSAVALSFAFAGPASAAPGVSQLCTDFGDIGVSHGECVSLVQNLNNEGSFAVGYCKLLDYYGLLDYYFKNQGQCVAYLRSLGY